jgi:hypothetical protein
VSGDYDWAIGLKASFRPLVTDGESTERVVGKIIEVRDDSPWPDEEHCRIVIDTGSEIYDVAKERVNLE